MKDYRLYLAIAIAFILTPTEPLASEPSSNPANQQLSSYAVLTAIDSATIASQFPGKLIKIDKREGDTFKQGEILFRFDCKQKRLQLATAKAKQNKAKAGYESAIKLKKYAAISDLEYAERHSQYQQAKNDWASLDYEVKHCELKAPYNGKVVEVIAQPHETVSSGQAIMKIINDDNFEVKMFVPSHWLRWVKINSPFTIKFNENNQTYRAKITKIGNKIDTASQTINLYGEIINAPKGQLIDGMSGRATFYQAE